MEVQVALRMFHRSLKKHKHQNTTTLSDGDSRTFHALVEDAVYSSINVLRKDFMNHVQK